MAAQLLTLWLYQSQSVKPQVAQTVCTMAIIKPGTHSVQQDRPVPMLFRNPIKAPHKAYNRRCQYDKTHCSHSSVPGIYSSVVEARWPPVLHTIEYILWQHRQPVHLRVLIEGSNSN